MTAEFKADIAAVKAIAAHNQSLGRPSAPGRCATTMAIVNKYGLMSKDGMAIMRAYLNAWVSAQIAA